MKLNYFNFKAFKDKMLLTNDFGDYVFLTQNEFRKVIAQNINTDSDLYFRLREHKMVYDESPLEFSSLMYHDLRESKNHINIATSLHIFVVTTSCNMRCVYCQANNGTDTPHAFMSEEIAERAVDIALQSPEKYLSFEFQGGEPLLNFLVIKHIVEYAERNNTKHDISYNLVSNLTLLTEEMLDFFCEHKFGISTSIDGPAVVHDVNRVFFDGKPTLSKTTKGIERVKEKGLHVGAIETTTRYSLNYPREIVRTYESLGFDSIFIRPLTPLGKAKAFWDTIGYTGDEFVEFYNKAFEEIVSINKNGRYMREEHAAILLRRIGGMSVNYMELQSPCGAGMGQLAYYSDGSIFTCDEGRMVFEMGQDTFRLGNVFSSSYMDLIDNSICKTVCASSILESLPSCCDCVYQPYCGTCPVVNYAMNKDVIVKEPNGYRCRIYKGILDSIFERLLVNDQEVVNILDSWRN